MLDVTIVAIALPSIQRDLGFSAAGLQWVITAYVLVFGGFLLLAGRAADLWGRRRWFMGGLGLFAAASLACGLARSPLALVAARTVQGLGAAVVTPSALAILTATFPHGQEEGAREARREPDRALGVWTAAAAGGGATGWLLGGVLSEGLGCASVAATAAGTAAAADRGGLGAGLLNAAAQVGTAMGLAVLVTVASSRSGALVRDGVPATTALVGGFRWALLGAAVVAAAGIAAGLCLVIAPGRRSRGSGW